MPTIDIQRRHELGTEQARSVVDRLAGRMAEKYGVDAQWQGDTLAFRHPALRGGIHVGAHDIRVEAKLGLLLSPLKARIEDEIRSKLDEYLGAEGDG